MLRNMSGNYGSSPEILLLFVPPLLSFIRDCNSPTHLHLSLPFPTSTLLRQTWQLYAKLLHHTESFAQHLILPRSAPQQVLKAALATCLGSMTFGRSTTLQMRRWKIKGMLQELHFQTP